VALRQATGSVREVEGSIRMERETCAAAAGAGRAALIQDVVVREQPVGSGVGF